MDKQQTIDIAALIADLKQKGAELIQANKEKLESEKKWRRAEFIINAAEEYMTLINRDYVYEMANDAYSFAYGAMSVDEIIGKTIYDQWGAERGEEIKGLIDRCFAGEVVRDCNWYDFPAIGKRYYEVSYYPYKCRRNGGITHAAVITHDETERKRAEECLSEKVRTLAETCKVFEQFLYYSPVAVYLKDDRLRLVKVKQVCRESKESSRGYYR